MEIEESGDRCDTVGGLKESIFVEVALEKASVRKLSWKSGKEGFNGLARSTPVGIDINHRYFLSLYLAIELSLSCQLYNTPKVAVGCLLVEVHCLRVRGPL